MSHPKLPIIFVGTDDGRIIVVALKIEHLPSAEQSAADPGEIADEGTPFATISAVCLKNEDTGVEKMKWFLWLTWFHFQPRVTYISGWKSWHRVRNENPSIV